jgi:hypothetical protein
MVRAFLVLPGALLGALFLSMSCQNLPSPTATCGEIPTGGCPIGRGGTCADVTCTALYDCVNSAWALSQSCTNPVNGGATAGRSGTDGGIAGPVLDRGACTRVSIDMSAETNDCMVDLMFPDCPAVAAQGCAESACLTGCSDFFLCSSAAWIDVAHCNDRGQVIVTQH